MSAPPVVWLNGRLVPAADAAVPADDESFLSGIGLFETMAVRDGRICRLPQHLARMAAAAALPGLVPASRIPDAQTVRRAVADLLAAAGLRDARIRLTVTPRTTLVTAAELPAHPHPARVLTCPWRRNPLDPLAGCKSSSAAANAVAHAWAAARSADEAIFLTTSGHLCEGSRTNLFLVRDGTVLTPPLATGCLPGVTRATVLETCRAHNLPAAESDLAPADLASCHEAFLTSSLRGIHPVATLDNRPLPAPGPLTARIASLLPTD